MPESEPIGRALGEMLRNDYSQVPVYADKEFRGLLTANTVARWLGSCAPNDLVSLTSTTIAQVLLFTEN